MSADFEGNDKDAVVTQQVLDVIDSYGFKKEGAYNLRLNGLAVCHGDVYKRQDLIFRNLIEFFSSCRKQISFRRVSLMLFHQSEVKRRHRNENNHRQC